MLFGTRPIGWLFFNSEGTKILYGLAIRTALTHAREIGISEICIKSDCHVLIALNSSHCYSADLYEITRDVQILSSFFAAFFFVFISLTLNFMVDLLAKTALYSNDSTHPTSFGPELVFIICGVKKHTHIIALKMSCN